MIILTPDQEKVIADTRKAYETYRSIIWLASTGWGKSTVTAWLFASVIAKNKRAYFSVHTDILVEQVEAVLKKAGIDYGKIVSGEPMQLEKPVQICLIQTLGRRLHKIPPPDLFVFDECVHIAAATWDKVYKWLPQSTRILGLTACCERLSGEPLTQYFQHKIEAPPMHELIEMGRLSTYRPFVPSRLDMAGAKTAGGDYTKASIDAKMNETTITGDTIKNYQSICPGKRAVVFSYSIPHSKKVVEAFITAGIPAEHIDGKTPRDERFKIIKRFESGETMILSSINLLIEGFNLESIEACIMLRPTKSLSVYLQMVGRSLRTFPGKECAYIIDAVGNILTHGLPSEPRMWTLEGRKKKKRGEKSAAPVKVCEHCYAVFTAYADHCPECGWVVPQNQRVIKEVEGELTEIDLKTYKRSKRMEVGRARTMADLIAIQKQRGYKRGWVYWQMKNKGIRA